jgi:hypothetical protein
VIRRGSAAAALGVGLALSLALAAPRPAPAKAAVPGPTSTLARSSPGPLGTLGATGSSDPAGEAGQDIRDIHGPVAIPHARSPWWYLGGAGAAVGAAAALALYLRRRRPPAPPHERALRALAAAGATLEGDPRQFSFAVSEIVRQYVEEAFRVRAAHRTTEELLADLMLDRSPVALHRTALGEFLRYCDLAKFAGWSLSPTDRSALLASAETFVRATSVSASPEQVRRAAIRGEGMA